MAKQTFTTGQVLTAAQMTSLQQTAMLGGAANAQTASYVLVATDAGKCVTMSNAGATTITVNTSLFAAGDTVTILNIGAGTCTITAGTATVSKPTNATLALVANAGGVLYFTAANTAFFMPFDVGSASSGFVGVQATKSGNQSINNATYTAITFDSENFDTDGFHSTATNTSRFTIPTGKGGKYLSTFTAGFVANTTGIRGAAWYKNGALASVAFQMSASSAADTFFASSQIFNLVAGDYLELFLYQSSGGALDVKGVTTDATSFSLQYLGA